jgi:acetyltransferase
MHIEQLTIDQFRAHRENLAALLKDCVDGGASVNFVKPFSTGAALAYWSKLNEAVANGDRIVLAAFDAGGTLIGSVQLVLATQPNGAHRAEVQKLLVHRSARGNGVGKALMAAIEDSARECGRTLLILDTERGSDAEHLYEKIGYSRAGGIPGFAMNVDGVLTDNVIFYRLVE